MKWHEKYNCHHARAGAFRLAVNWSTTRGRKWEVAFEGTKIRRDFDDLDEAKAAAAALARNVLLDALAALPPEPADD